MSESLIRVLVVDDSSFMRRSLTRLIDEGRNLQVVGSAANGREALKMIADLQPDVVTMDVEMPEMDGVRTLEAIMRKRPVPVVMLSSLNCRDTEVTLRCLELGAVDFLCKPVGSMSNDISSIRYILWQKLRSAAQACVQPTLVIPRSSSRLAVPSRRSAVAKRLVAIGASTGGPNALLTVLQALPADLPAGVLVVQHMPAEFTAPMAKRFNQHCAITVREAAQGEHPLDGTALIAPGGRHLLLDQSARVLLTDDPPVWGVRPAVDLMMESTANLFMANCLGAILTGMGRDGTKGLARIKESGGASIAQDKSTSVVYGMPRSAVEAGVVDRTLPLSQIGEEIVKWCRGDW